MGKIKILSDRDGVYEVGQIVNVMDFISDYCSSISDKGTIGWIQRIPMSSAVNFIADAWGINYEFV